MASVTRSRHGLAGQLGAGVAGPDGAGSDCGSVVLAGAAQCCGRVSIAAGFGHLPDVAESNTELIAAAGPFSTQQRQRMEAFG